jgi:hypothetical protein
MPPTRRSQDKARDRGDNRTYARMVLYEVASDLAYLRAREATREGGSDLSVFHLDKEGVWCVAVLGDAPPVGALGEELDRHLDGGTAFALPPKVVDALFAFRRRMLRAAEGREDGERRH